MLLKLTPGCHFPFVLVSFKSNLSNYKITVITKVKSIFQINTVPNWAAVQYNTRGQFHHHFTHVFFIQKFLDKTFLCFKYGLNFFWRKEIGANALIKCWRNWPQGRRCGNKPLVISKRVVVHNEDESNDITV
jgi:hypothetical protein